MFYNLRKDCQINQDRSLIFFYYLKIRVEVLEGKGTEKVKTTIKAK